jgi:uncharacterized protein (TIGR02391 family)
MDKKRSMQVAIARLNAIKLAVLGNTLVRQDILTDFHQVLDSIRDAAGADVEPYRVPATSLHNATDGKWCQATTFNSKIQQAIAALGLYPAFSDDSALVRAGALFTSITDSELRDRCSDLLTAPSHFDRAINQATQVLENRIRKKSGAPSTWTGTELVNKTIKSDPNISILVLSTESAEQEGMSNLCRGMMMTYRNETHHQLTDRYSREDALKVCAFIDLLLRAIDEATVQVR